MKTVASRLARIKSHIDNTVCPKDAGVLVAALADCFDPGAIAILIQLLDHSDARADHAELALVRFGESAEEALRACVAHADSTSVQRVRATTALGRIAYRARVEQLLGNLEEDEFDLVA